MSAAVSPPGQSVKPVKPTSLVVRGAGEHLYLYQTCTSQLVFLRPQTLAWSSPSSLDTSFPFPSPTLRTASLLSSLAHQPKMVAPLGARFLYKIVRNEAMKQDPPEIYGWRVFMLAVSACFGGTLFGMDIGIIGGVLTLPAFKKYVKIPSRLLPLHMLTAR